MSSIDHNLQVQLLGYAAAVNTQAPASLIARYNDRLTAIAETYLPEQLDRLIDAEEELREQRRHLDEAIGELRDEQADLERQISANVKAQIAIMTAPGCEALDRPSALDELTQQVARDMRAALAAGDLLEAARISEQGEIDAEALR